MKKKILLVVGLVFVLSLFAFAAGSKEGEASFPTKPITIVVYTKPGGLIDVTARKFTDIAKKYTDATLLGLGGKWHDGNLTIEHILRRFGISGGFELNKLKTDLIQQLIKYNQFSTAILN
jgi:hypothetical protein